jgi:hypothetical protein
MFKSLNIFILLLSLLLFSFSDGNKKKNDLEVDNLHGKVKSIRLYSYNVYDERQLSIDNKNDKYFKLYVSYNKDGFTTTIAESINITSGKRKEYKYDSNGCKIEMIIYRADSVIDYRDIYKYNKDGNLIESDYYSADDTIPSKTIYKYDKGNLIEVDDLDPDGTLFGKTIYNPPFDKKTFKYDNKNILIEVCDYDLEGSLSGKFIYKYDAKGNKIEDSWVDHKDIVKDVYTYNYEFDKNDNWIKVTRIYNGKSKFIQERVIEYY